MLASNDYFTQSLITPRRLSDEWHSILYLPNLPGWVKGIHVVHTSPDDGAEQRCPDEVVVALGTGPERCKDFKFTTPGFVLLLELCRPGHSCGVNANSSTPPTFYPQLIFEGDGWRANEAAARVLTDSGPGEVVKAAGGNKDMTSGSLYRTPGSRATRHARQVAIAHAIRLAAERPGRLPGGVSVEPYGRHLHDLFGHYDAVCASYELVGQPIPTEGEEA